MKERKKLKEIYLEHRDAIKKIILISIPFLGFIWGWFVSYIFFPKPLNDNQFQICEQVACNVYYNIENPLLEIPEGYSVSISKNKIEVAVDESTYVGSVIAEIQNGELIIKRNCSTVDVNSRAMFTGLIFSLVVLLIEAGVSYEIHK